MSNELQIIDESTITVEAKAEINEDIDRIIDAHKNNRQVINKLVFASIAAMAEADDAQSELSNKGFFKRLIGGITGSNGRLQNRINSSRAEAMYASQQTLQKLAEQNLMTFDLIAAVNNKLNASLIKVDEEFANLYTGLAKFFKASRSELARIETRLEKVERNVNLLNWSRSIEYQEFDGIEYAELDDISKIVCLVRDFYDITKGEWSNSDLLLLKSTMKEIDILPKENVNYFEVLKWIYRNENLKKHMLDGRKIEPIEDPNCLLSLACIEKLERLDNEESYMVDTIIEQMSSMGLSPKREVVCNQLTAKYLTTKAFVDVNVNVEYYDLILDLLYNIKFAKNELLLSSNDIDRRRELFKLGQSYFNGDGVEIDYVKALQYHKRAADLGEDCSMGMLGHLYREGLGVEKDYSKAMEWYKKAVDLGNDIAMGMIGLLYEEGLGVKQDYGKAMEWYKKSADLGNDTAMYSIGCFYENGLGVEKDYSKAMEWYKKSAELNCVEAMNGIACLYLDGKGVEQSNQKAMEWLKKAADLGNVCAMCSIGMHYEIGLGISQDKVRAMEWYKKATDLVGDVAIKIIEDLRNSIGEF